MKNVCAPIAEKVRKSIIKIFKQEFDFNIISETNLKIVNFLDVTLTFQPENINLITNRTMIPYILMLTPTTHQTSPNSISRRINKLSSDEHVFNSTKDLYNNALKNSGYKQNVKFQNNVFVEVQKRKNNRGRKIVWFNAPYICSVATNIGKNFFLLLEKHSPKTHIFYKIFNRKNVRVSYSLTPNISSIIKSHNNKVLSNDKLNSS